MKVSGGKTVWKYPLAVHGGTQPIWMPEAAEIVEVAGQGGSVCLWAVVDPDALHDYRDFVVTGTGHPVPDGYEQYIGTAHCPPFVWHVWERRP